MKNIVEVTTQHKSSTNMVKKIITNYHAYLVTIPHLHTLDGAVLFSQDVDCLVEWHA